MRHDHAPHDGIATSDVQHQHVRDAGHARIDVSSHGEDWCYLCQIRQHPLIAYVTGV
jgi:hypothetical protein